MPQEFGSERQLNIQAYIQEEIYHPFMCSVTASQCTAHYAGELSQKATGDAGRQGYSRWTVPRFYLRSIVTMNLKEM